jgi:hypothetical protein
MWPFRIFSSSGHVDYVKLGVSDDNNTENFHHMAKVELVNSNHFTIVFTKIGTTQIGMYNPI